MDFTTIYQNLPLYFSGMWVTIQLLVLSLAAGLMLAFPLALLASARSFWVRVLPKTYIYCFRGTPLLVQMFLIYHGFAQFDAVRESFLWIIFKEAYWCALIAFALNTSAYTAEILRGAIAQTAAGEIEAGRAYGMSNRILYMRVILPSACRRALPAYGNEMIFMLHGTALAGVITIVDLFGAAKIINSRYFVPFEAFISAGFLYLCMSFLIITAVKYAEKYWLRYLRV